MKCLVATIAAAILLPAPGRAAADTSRLMIYDSSFVAQLTSVPEEGYAIYPDRLPARRGYLRVPENRANPNSRDILLGFWQLRSSAARPRAPILFFYGGPGHAYADAASRPHMFDRLRALTAFADVIIVDQRGAGAPSISVPSLQCPNMFASPLSEPWQSRRAYIAATAAHVASCVAYFTRGGADLRGYNSAQSADDADDLRRALGYRKLNIWGESYGGYLAQMYLDRHGAHVERAVIGITAAAQGAVRGANPAGAMFATLASGYTSSSGRAVPPDPTLESDARAAMLRLSEAPLTVRVKRPDTGETVEMAIGRYDLQFAIAWALHGDTDSWDAIGPGVRAILKGDAQWVARRMIAFRLGLHRSNVQGKLMGYLMNCSATPLSPENVTVPAFEADLFEGESINGPFPEICATLKGHAQPDPPLRGSGAETLFWAAELDATTPLSDTLAARTLFPNSRVLVLEAASHAGGNDQQSRVLEARILDFLKGGSAALGRPGVERIGRAPASGD